MQLRFNKIWSGVFLFLFTILTILFFNWLLALFGFLKLNTKTIGQVETFSVQQLSENSYGIEASYSFEVEGRNYRYQQILTNPRFLNHYAAQTHLEKYWKAEPWPVWYYSKDPKISSLQKLFPVKKFFGFFIGLSVVVYFLWLRKYVISQES
jgi:hypothetical protein